MANPKPNATRTILETVQKVYPQYHTDPDMNAIALVGLAHVTGAVAAWWLNNRGEQSLEKALAMFVTKVREQAHEGDSLIRQKKQLIVNDLGGKLIS